MVNDNFAQLKDLCKSCNQEEINFANTLVFWFFQKSNIRTFCLKRIL